MGLRMSINAALPYVSRPHSAAEALRRAITSGALKPGERLVELKLAASFQIGQPTLREALKELEHQGYIRKVPHRGSYVTELRSEDLRKVHTVRMALEPLAFKLAAKNINADAVKRLTAIVAAMEEAAHELDRVSFHNADIDFHRTVWNLAGNEYIEMALERVLFGMFAAVLAGQQKDAFLKSVQQHRENLGALASGNPEAARLAFVNSTMEFWKTYYQLDSDSEGEQ